MILPACAALLFHFTALIFILRRNASAITTLISAPRHKIGSVPRFPITGWSIAAVHFEHSWGALIPERPITRHTNTLPRTRVQMQQHTMTCTSEQTPRKKALHRIGWLMYPGLGGRRPLMAFLTFISHQRYPAKDRTKPEGIWSSNFQST